MRPRPRARAGGQPASRRGARRSAAAWPSGDRRDTGEPVDEREFEKLRTGAWTRAEGKPAFTVAADAVLAEVLRVRPRTSGELIEIRGIGPAFCEKHGESLLAALSALEGAAA